MNTNGINSMKAIYLATAVALGLGSSVAAPAAPYVAVDIGHLGGGQARPGAVNGKGQVVGSSITAASAGGQTAAFSYQNGTMVDIGSALFGKLDSFAAAVSENGHIVMVGMSAGADQARALATTDANGANAREFSLVGGVISPRLRGGYAGAVFVNDSGQVAVNLYEGEKGQLSPKRVVDAKLEAFGTPGATLTAFNAAGMAGGTYSTADAPDRVRGFVMNAAGVRMDVGDGGGGQSWVNGLNDFGVAVGATLLSGGSRAAVVYDPATGSLSRLEGFLGSAPQPGRQVTEADDINDHNEVVGRLTTLVNGRSEVHAFVGGAGYLIDLGMSLEDLHINNLGQVLGRHDYAKREYPSPNDFSDMFLWDHGTMTNLDEMVRGLGIVDVMHAVLGDNGHLAGWGLDAQGFEHAFHLYRPTDGGGEGQVPEPGTLALALLVLTPLAVGRRRGRW